MGYLKSFPGAQRGPFPEAVGVIWGYKEMFILWVSPRVENLSQRRFVDTDQALRQMKFDFCFMLKHRIWVLNWPQKLIETLWRELIAALMFSEKPEQHRRQADTFCFRWSLCIFAFSFRENYLWVSRLVVTNLWVNVAYCSFYGEEMKLPSKQKQKEGSLFLFYIMLNIQLETKTGRWAS